MGLVHLHTPFLLNQLTCNCLTIYSSILIIRTLCKLAKNRTDTDSKYSVTVKARMEMCMLTVFIGPSHPKVSLHYISQKLVTEQKYKHKTK